MTELGQVLKQTREEKGITLDELQRLTKIQKRYLVAIEEGNYTILPGDFYVRAFIKQYAEAVGLNHEEIATNYKHEVPQPPSHEEQQEENLSRVKKHKETMPSKTPKVFDYLPRVIIGALIVLLAFGIWRFWPSKNQSTAPNQENLPTEVEKDENSPVNKDKEEKPEEPVVEEEVETPQPTQQLKVVETSGKNSTVELSGNEAFLLEITCTGESYLEVKNNKGKKFFSGMIKKDEIQTFDLATEDVIIINAGRSLDVQLKVNGEAVAFPQDVNELVHQIVTIKNLRTPLEQESSQ